MFVISDHVYPEGGEPAFCEAVISRGGKGTKDFETTNSDFSTYQNVKMDFLFQRLSFHHSTMRIIHAMHDNKSPGINFFDLLFQPVYFKTGDHRK